MKSIIPKAPGFSREAPGSRLQAPGRSREAPDSGLQAPGRKCNQEPSSSLLRVPLPTCWQCPQGSPASSLRPAFTLTELLVVISIIGMLAGLSLGALYTARESAKVAKTKSTIAKLDQVIQAKYAEFFTRRMPIANRRLPPDAMAELRFRVLHEIIRMEMPDRYTDVAWPRDPSNTSGQLIGDMIPADSVAKVYPIAQFADTGTRGLRYYVDMNGATSTSIPDPTTGSVAGMQRTSLGKRFWRQLYSNKATATTDFDSAECLYMIVQADPDARERFQADEVGDADEDGMKEFHDAWGKPIQFYRWAPGFAPESELMSGDAESDPDPLNPRRIGDLVQENGKWHRPANIAMFRLVPLIVSAGPDGIFALNTVNVNYEAQMRYASPSNWDSVNKVWIDGADIGRPADSGDTNLLDEVGHHSDNIHNHSLGMN